MDELELFDAVGDLFGFSIGLLQQMGLYKWVVGALFAWLVLGISMRVIDAIGGGK